MTGSVPLSLRPEHPAPRRLDHLVEAFGFEARGDCGTREITGAAISSAAVVPGDLYVGVPGRNVHGADFSEAAVRLGAVAILTDHAGGDRAAKAGVPVLVTDQPRAVLGAVASWIYRTNEMPACLLGVTGTNGKTTVVYLLDGLARQLGLRTGLTSTAERRIAEVATVSSLTTPEATELHALLARMREENVAVVSIEVSAQALTRHRIDGILFDVVGFTNLSHDHLDDYRDMNDYFRAKQDLFRPERASRGVVTVDSEWGRKLAREATIPVTTLATLPGVDADWTLQLRDQSLTSTVFSLTGPLSQSIEVRISLVGAHNAANAALAIVMLVTAGYDLERIQNALTDDGEIDAYVPGRTEKVSGEDGPLVLIDYGHTPDAFLATLTSLRPLVSGRIIMLFGADGDRDTTKRAEMGAIAARGADVVIITDFHPRSEDPALIRHALIAGALAAEPERELYEIARPEEALRAAIALAKKDDVVLYAGPGHEDYREVSGQHLPYSARDDARLALREAGLL